MWPDPGEGLSSVESNQAITYFGFGFGFTTAWDRLSRHSIKTTLSKQEKLKSLIYTTADIWKFFMARAIWSLVKKFTQLPRYVSLIPDMTSVRYFHYEDQSQLISNLDLTRPSAKQIEIWLGN